MSKSILEVVEAFEKMQSAFDARFETLAGQVEAMQKEKESAAPSVEAEMSQQSELFNQFLKDKNRSQGKGSKANNGATLSPEFLAYLNDLK